MAERRGGSPDPETTTTVRGEDWYGREVGAEQYAGVRFVDVDLTEASTRGTVFSECVFSNVAFNVSHHASTAFVNCTFRRCNFFDATFTGCKLVGAMFDGCSFGIMKVDRGDWSFAGFPGADLEGVEFTGVRLRESDLTHARCARSVFAGCDLSGSWLHGADFTDADLRGSALGEIDPRVVTLRGATITADQAIAIAAGLGLVVDV
ncbi:pentapeptide repeat-containing protein [Beutenbergia cavernae DSM 12333]|uniref:Pentapeptide repeat-containing protein n=1 Tax=Beutenbergia cavernae (strain ATCC BAA-8 / DSM 12333 / CCUG 43141 / JCM 11478 / NBRC 16432 / NCIMB 13614 / HKI 0122) TaxID=471853 RepID=C5BVM3_BEUC1|nr:pentapeptide repeat-containing protein [Beutenbergia cavernae]ACQ78463.1 pentapeptide repeat-containing protein [Beutenbergia cavernae DSM 12333]